MAGPRFGWGGPQAGVTVYGSGTTQFAAGELTTKWNGPQISDANSLPRERVWVDDLGNFHWGEYTVVQCEVWPAAIYPVLVQGGTWRPTDGEPFLNPAGSIQSGTNGWVLRFGGIPFQTYLLQTASDINGSWNTRSEPVAADVTRVVQFTDITSASATEYYHTQGSAAIY